MSIKIILVANVRFVHQPQNDKPIATVHYFECSKENLNIHYLSYLHVGIQGSQLVQINKELSLRLEKQSSVKL